MKQLAIVIPAYKERFLRATLDSIAAQTNRSDFVLYIGDDASPDRLDRVVESYRDKIDLVYHRFTENWGGKDLVAHWERCIRLSHEPVIWLFSDDDRMPADGVERILEALKHTADPSKCFFRFPLTVIDGQDRLLHANPPLPEGKVSHSRLLLDKLQGKADSAAIEYVFGRRLWMYSGGFVRFPLAWCSDDATWTTFARLAGGVTSLPGKPVCWRNVEGSNISNSSCHNAEKLCATVLFLKWLRKELSDDARCPELVKALQCYVRTILRFSVGKDYGLHDLWTISSALALFDNKAACRTFFRNFRLFPKTIQQ